MFGKPVSLTSKATRFLWVAILASASNAIALGYGLDAGQEPGHYAENLSAAGLTGINGGWLRARGIAGSGGEGDHPGRTTASDRAGIEALHARGVKVCIILRWGPQEWIGEVRRGGGHRLPINLREPYERARKLAETYGDLVDAWEIENEPDITFVMDNPETYAAFFKATSLGIKAGAEIARNRAAKMAGPSPQHSTAQKPLGITRAPWLENKLGFASRIPRISRPTITNPNTRSRVVMAPLALPPGPYFENLWANDLSSYTDAFNFHYYGYSEDFTGVYRQFEHAVKTTPTPTRTGLRSTTVRKDLPVFITEYGFGLLDADARFTPAGRIRQWRWFADVAQQIRNTRPEASMAFILNPYLEAGINEFGLAMHEPARLSMNRLPKTTEPATPSNSLQFTPADFGASEAKPWMNRIGQKIGGAYASPALAQLWGFAEQEPYRSRAWPVQASSAPSPIVVDFIAGADMQQTKTSGGYALQSASPRWSPTSLRVGNGTWVLYNFSTVPVSGNLTVTPPQLVTSSASKNISLAPGERLEIPVEFTIPAADLTRHPIKAAFGDTTVSGPISHFSTNLFPATYAMVTTRVTDLRTSTAPTTTISEQLARKPAIGEPQLQQDGRWLKTDGVHIVDDHRGHWRFEIQYLPTEPLRPAMVELPLPPDFEFKPDTALRFEYRRTPAAPRSSNNSATEAVLKPRAANGVDAMDVYFRTANGNLYQTWPRRNVRPEWSAYCEDSNNFTMGFFGRAALPWRFAENRPVALVFFLRPAQVPTAFEVRGTSIVGFHEL